MKLCVIGSELLRQQVEKFQTYPAFRNVELTYCTTNPEVQWQDLIPQIQNEGIEAVIAGPIDYQRFASHHDTVPFYLLQPSFTISYPFLAEGPSCLLLSDVEDRYFTLIGQNDEFVSRKIYGDLKSLKECINELVSAGVKNIIGNNIVVSQLRSMDVPCKAHYFYNETGLLYSITNAYFTEQQDCRARTLLQNLEVQFNNEICILLIQQDATVAEAGKNLNRAFGLSEKGIRGKPVEIFVPRSAVLSALRQNSAAISTEFQMNHIKKNACIFSITYHKQNCAVLMIFLSDVKRLMEPPKAWQSPIVGCSDLLRQQIAYAEKYAKSSATVLITAETGAGKEVFAHFIHQKSDRSSQAFVTVSCGSIPETLIESELFGYVKGAFTDASIKGKPGLIETADKGTVLLDDIDTLSLAFQVKLLRVLQEGVIYRVGGLAPIPVDVRFIATTNQNLKQLVSEGRFRIDLFYRISVLRLTIPPLRERPADIVPLYQYYLQKLHCKLPKYVLDHFDERFSFVLQYPYPGNVRELIAVVQRFQALLDEEQADDIDYLAGLLRYCIGEGEWTSGTPSKQDTSGAQGDPAVSGNYSHDVFEAEKRIFAEYYRRYRGDVNRMASDLGLGRTTIYKKIRQFMK